MDYMEKEKVYNLLKQYETPSERQLGEAIDAIKQLIEANEISKELGEIIAKLLISKQVHEDLTFSMRNEMRAERHEQPSGLKLMGFKYGRKHETYV